MVFALSVPVPVSVCSRRCRSSITVCCGYPGSICAAIVPRQAENPLWRGKAVQMAAVHAGLTSLEWNPSAQPEVKPLLHQTCSQTKNLWLPSPDFQLYLRPQRRCPLPSRCVTAEVPHTLFSSPRIKQRVAPDSFERDSCDLLFSNHHHHLHRRYIAK